MPVGKDVGRGIKSIEPDREPVPRQPIAIFVRVGKYQGCAADSVDPVAGQHRQKCHGDRRHIAMSAELADEPAAGPQCPRDPGDHRVRISLHPMQRRVGEHGVELALERQARSIRQSRVDAALAGRANHVGIGIDTDHLAPGLCEPSRQRSVATAKVKDALTRRGRQKLDHGQSRARPRTAHAPRSAPRPTLGQRKAIALILFL